MQISTLGVNDDGEAHVTVRGIAFQNALHLAPDALGGGLDIRCSAADVQVISGTSWAAEEGGGFRIVSSGGSIRVINNMVTGRTNGLDGGGVWAGTSRGSIALINNTLTGNVADRFVGSPRLR